jgi:GNAT superfamily N-acetyltransferase
MNADVISSVVQLKECVDLCKVNKGDKMEIRKLNKTDKLPIELLLLADPSREIVEEYVNRGECFVAESEQQIIGVYVLLPTRPETVELVNVAVVQEQHGRGIGKRLVMDAKQVAKTKGYKTIEIGTGNSSIGQLALYQKCGFRIVGVDINFFVRHYQIKFLKMVFSARIWFVYLKIYSLKVKVKTTGSPAVYRFDNISFI